MRIGYRVPGCRSKGNRRRKSRASLRISSPSFESLEARRLLSLSPYLGSPVAISDTAGTTTIVEAENFDNGGEGVAYHVTARSDNGVQYRPGEGGGIETTSDSGGGYDVGGTAAGDWLGYSINVASAGSYDITVRIASATAMGKNAGYFHLEFGPTGQVGGPNVTRSGLFVVPGTDGWQTWQDVTLKGVPLSAGDQWMRLVEDTVGWNINSVEFTPSTDPHQTDASKDEEHAALLALVPDGDATSTAITSGNWSSPSTWAGGVVPGAGAKVDIPAGYTVTYDVSSTDPLKWLRVNGTLTFSTTQNTKLTLDTFVVSPQGTLIIGTAANPIPANVTAEVDFPGGAPIDTIWDPTELSRGLISHGSVTLYGAKRDPFVTLSGNALAGDTSLTLSSSVPSNWQVGDKVVLTGTSLDPGGSNSDNSHFHDEVLTITGINGGTLTFTNDNLGGSNNNRLRYDHTAPAGYGLSIYVANLTRNIVFRTLDAANVPTQQRAHVMFMHNPAVDVENAGFYDLGRTDKTTPIDDVGVNENGTQGQGTNVRGRYAVHFHRTGSADKNSPPAKAIDDVVWGSPGWGFVNHDSNVLMQDNVAFDVVGASFITEVGTELGSFIHNIAIKGRGDGQRHEGDFLLTSREENFDFGFTGDGFWLQGGVLLASVKDNVVASMAGFGFMTFGSDEGIPENMTFQVQRTNLPDPSIITESANFYGVLPIRSFDGNTAYNVNEGLDIWKMMRHGNAQLGVNSIRFSSNHNVRSRFTNMKIWGVNSEGIFLEYASHVELENFLILGNPSSPITGTYTGVTMANGFGIANNEESRDLHLKNVRIEGFQNAFQVPYSGVEGTRDNPPLQLNESVFDSVAFAHNTNNLVMNVDSSHNPVEFPKLLNILPNTTFSPAAGDPGPTASFSATARDGLEMSFDSSGSSSTFNPVIPIAGDKIAAYTWDFGDGTTGSGRFAYHVYETPGNYTVKLTVYDVMGQTTTISRVVDVTVYPYTNRVNDSSLTISTQFTYYNNSALATLNSGKYTAAWLNPGNIWGGYNVSPDPTNGWAQLGPGWGGLYSSYLDDHVVRGVQPVSFDLWETGPHANTGSVQLFVWGINGQFQFDSGNINPMQVGTIPVSITPLVQGVEMGGIDTGGKFVTRTSNVNFGSGYEYIAYFIAMSNFDAANGDIVRIDNVSVAAGGIPPVAT